MYYEDSDISKSKSAIKFTFSNCQASEAYILDAPYLLIA